MFFCFLVFGYIEIEHSSLGLIKLEFDGFGFSCVLF